MPASAKVPSPIPGPKANRIARVSRPLEFTAKIFLDPGADLRRTNAGLVVKFRGKLWAGLELVVATREK